MAEDSQGIASFLGIGVQPPNPSWGSMLSEGRSYLNVAWWLMTFPGLVITVNVLAVNLLGAWFERYLQPHRKQSQT